MSVSGIDFPLYETNYVNVAGGRVEHKENKKERTSEGGRYEERSSTGSKWYGVSQIRDPISAINYGKLLVPTTRRRTIFAQIATNFIVYAISSL